MAPAIMFPALCAHRPCRISSQNTRHGQRFGQTLNGDRFLASQFSVAYSSGRKAQRTDIEFRNGNVKSTTHDPERKARVADWVPLSDKDLRSVLDPLSGLLFPAGSEVCPRSLPIFDGQSRVTLHLSPKGMRPFRSQGLQGRCDCLRNSFRPKCRLPQELFGDCLSAQPDEHGSLVRQARQRAVFMRRSMPRSRPKIGQVIVQRHALADSGPSITMIAAFPAAWICGMGC
jgi:hypothetical protein